MVSHQPVRWIIDAAQKYEAETQYALDMYRQGKIHREEAWLLQNQAAAAMAAAARDIFAVRLDRPESLRAEMDRVFRPGGPARPARRRPS